jgi:hypothetical protein
MRLPFCLALAAATAAAAADPAPLLKPVAPPAGQVRVRVPVAEDKTTFMQFKAVVPTPKGKDGKTAEAKVMLDTLPLTPVVTLKTWERWGFEVPPNRTGVIPELVIPAGQLAPNLPKGRDVELRLTNVKVEIREPGMGQDPTWGHDLRLSLRELTKGADRAAEPRVYFADKFVELTAPAAAVKKLDAGPDALPDPAVDPDAALVPVAGPHTAQTQQLPPVFAFASVNGHTAYKTAAGKAETVNAGVASTFNWWGGSGVMLTMNTARGCGVELTDEKADDGGKAVVGKVKELRLGVLTGPGLKAPRDVVLKDLKVFVSDDESAAYVLLGTRFIEDHFADAVYGCGPDGAWRFHARVKPDLLQDVKTRTPPPKKP